MDPISGLAGGSSLVQRVLDLVDRFSRKRTNAREAATKLKFELPALAYPLGSRVVLNNKHFKVKMRNEANQPMRDLIIAAVGRSGSGAPTALEEVAPADMTFVTAARPGDGFVYVRVPWYVDSSTAPRGIECVFRDVDGNQFVRRVDGSTAFAPKRLLRELDRVAPPETRTWV